MFEEDLLTWGRVSRASGADEAIYATIVTKSSGIGTTTKKMVKISSLFNPKSKYKDKEVL